MCIRDRRVPFPQPFTPIQQEDLGPQIIKPVRGRRAGKFHHPVDMAADAGQRLKPFGLVAFKDVYKRQYVYSSNA